MESYVIYNASAGSGKTYGLVKAYLKIVLNSKNPDTFRSLLAITFTNKAVFEMKNRIIEMLMLFSDEKSLTQPHSMFTELEKELKMAPVELQMRSQRVLTHILHNYAAFSINTIDGFNHRLIRNFAFDLHLNQFFEVQMDAKTILQKSVDNLLARAGEIPEITQLLTQFSKEKIKEDKNWDATKELLAVAEMLTKENHYQALQTIKEKTIADFEALETCLKNKRRQNQQVLKNASQRFLQITEEKGLDESAFLRGSVYKFFRGVFLSPENEPSWDLGWQADIFNEEKPLYPTSKAKFLDTDRIEALRPEIVKLFEEVKQAYANINFFNNALNLIVPLALLGQIQNEIEQIKKEDNILPIWEFNGVISKEIISQPAPFIYERIGERYRHYFIDEFQDTSVLQWNNFIPLILNAVQSESINNQRGSVLLVGDAKQSIYRWRGGRAEQFMELYLGEKNPFFVPGIQVNLLENYRSLPEIIRFNNAFFTFVAQKFETPKYRDLYEKNTQNIPKNKQENALQGYLNIQFVSPQENIYDNEDENAVEFLSEREQTYCKAVLEAIQHANSCGVADKDICILVRKNQQGTVLASFLSSEGKNIISSESLLLDNVASIRFLVALLTMIYKPESQESKFNMLLEFVTLKKTSEIHRFITHYMEVPIETFFKDFHFSTEIFFTYSFYEGIAYAIQCFELAEDSDAYLSHFMNIVFDFKNKRRGGIAEFLQFWEDEKDKLSINTPEGFDAISIMTVHKSKGLSAPVIIYAFADSPIGSPKREAIWYPVNPDEFEGFSNLLVKNTKSLALYHPDSAQVVKSLEEQQLLDDINVLYVALTRPESFLYVITALPTKKSDSYGTLFQEFLAQQGQWHTEKNKYEFGVPVFVTKAKETPQNGVVAFQKGWKTPSYKIATKSAMLWDTSLQNAIEKGNIMHHLLAQLTYANEMDWVIEKSVSHGIIQNEQRQHITNLLKQMINHEKIKPFFSEDYRYFTERDFLGDDGNYFRPDRIALTQDDCAYIIDYKTGKHRVDNELQMAYYAENLQNLGWTIKGLFLVYINTEVEVIELKM
ncbi:UvrD-helicase domain-containing protein [Capnocytophaga canimorsus]|uniref:UvrD-helicase domain-containing protein n=1 Tax=Capnocytophaga canimorsus TaxID=28188 RepID=UPI0037CD36EE